MKKFIPFFILLGIAACTKHNIPTKSVVVEHDSRTKLTEPAGSRIR